jgi:hypothetical protein
LFYETRLGDSTAAEFRHDGIGDAADSFDGDGDGVAIFEKELRVSALSHAGRCTGEDYVSLLQRGEFGDSGDEGWDAEDQVDWSDF